MQKKQAATSLRVTSRLKSWGEEMARWTFQRRRFRPSCIGLRMRYSRCGQIGSKPTLGEPLANGRLS